MGLQSGFLRSRPRRRPAIPQSDGTTAMTQDGIRVLFKQMVAGDVAATREISSYLQSRSAKADAGDLSARNELEQLVYDVSYDIVSQRMRRSFPFLIGRCSVAEVLHAGWERLLETSPEPLDDLAAYCRRILSMVRYAFLDIVTAQRELDKCQQASTVFYNHTGDSHHHLNTQFEGSDSQSPISLAIWSEFHDQIQELPDGVRNVFELHYYLGLPRHQIASQLKMTEHRVRVLVLDASQRLGRAFPDIA